MPVFAAFWMMIYVCMLVLKVALALTLAFLGAANRYVILPGFITDRRRGRAERLAWLVRLAMVGPSIRRVPASLRLSRFVTYEALIAVVVFGCTAVLGESTPKRHEGHVSRGGESESTPFRVSMQELHASGGVPPGWNFAPPAGDAAKGREVFTRLECFTCHAVAGERFPRPSKPGPALTGVGGHHPAGYLLESIMNPNAVIVEAPGYTGPDGRSIMPDYRDSLSARDLIDLVAYLKSLGG